MAIDPSGATQKMALRFPLLTFCVILAALPLLLDAKTLKRDGLFLQIFHLGCSQFLLSLCLFVYFCGFGFNSSVKALNEIKASLGWRVVYAWVGDDPCGDGDLPAWSGVTCSTQGDYRVVTEL